MDEKCFSFFFFLLNESAFKGHYSKWDERFNMTKKGIMGWKRKIILQKGDILWGRRKMQDNND